MNALECQRVSLVFGQQTVFEDVDFTLAAGKTAILTGPSGSGKSSFFRLLTGQIPLSSEAQVCFFDQMAPAAVWQSCGVLFQNPDQQFTMATLREEAEFTLGNEQIAPVEITQRITAVTAEFQTSHLLDRPIFQLSGGEKQQAAMSLLAMMDRPFLLLDEPFAKVDRKSRERLIEQCALWQQSGRTLLIIDHEWQGYERLNPEYFEVRAHKIQRVQAAPRALDGSRLNRTNRVEQVRSSLFELEAVRLHRNPAFPAIEAALIPEGITLLTGENGAGKSTLLRLLVGLEKTTGKIQYRGKKVKRRKPASLSLAVQEAEKQFVCLGIGQELAYGRSRKAQRLREQTAALSYFGLEKKQHESWFTLSEGQKKIVQLLCLLAADTTCLLLDEPFTGLDERARTYFLQWIQRRYQEEQQSFVVVSHQPAEWDNVATAHLELTRRGLHAYSSSKKAI